MKLIHLILAAFCAILLISCGGSDKGEAAGRSDSDQRERQAPAEAPSLAIKPAPLSAAMVEYKLPAEIDDLVVGGGGRFLILHLQNLRKLAIFDVNEAKITKELLLESDDIAYTAGAEKLFIALRDQKVLQRYDLLTFELELSKPIPLAIPLSKIAIGSAATGPLLVTAVEGKTAELKFIDPATFLEADLKLGESVRDRTGVFGATEGDLTVSSNGSVFAYDPHGLAGSYNLVVRGDEAALSYHPEGFGSLIPSPDGRQLYTAKGVRSLDGRRLGGDRFRPMILPARSGNFTMSSSMDGEPRDEKRFLAIHFETETRPLITLPQVEIPLLGNPEVKAGLLPSKRVIYVPDAKLIAVVPKLCDRLILHAVDIDKLLVDAGIDYLFVRSRPELTYSADKRYSYQLDVKSKNGGLLYWLHSGPEGMVLSDDGLLTWTPGSERAVQPVILRISDSSGQEKFQTFQLEPAASEGDATVANAAASPADGRSRSSSRRNVLPVKYRGPPRPTPAVGSSRPPVTAPSPPAPTLVNPELPEITSFDMEGDVLEVKLPGPFDDIVVGGGGRYLILYHKALRKLTILDSSVGKVIESIPLPAGEILCAAGGDSLIVLLLDQQLIQRWSLKTFELELTQSIGELPTRMWMGMGSGSGGPLVLGDERGVGARYYDPKTLNRIAIKERFSTIRGIATGSKYLIRVSANGKTIGAWSRGTSSSGLYSTILQGASASGSSGDAALGYAVPSPDGAILYTAGGAFTPSFRQLGDSDLASVSFPAVHGNLYLKVGRTDGSGEPPPLSIHLAGDSRPLVSVPRIKAVADPDPKGSGDGISIEKRFIYIPDAKILVTHPPERDKLIVHKLDLDVELKNSEVDYFFVASRAPQRVQAGETWSHKPAVRSKAGGVKLSLEAAPEGMKLDGESLAWELDPSEAPGTHLVILNVTDSSGQELIHKFRLAVGDSPIDAAPVVSVPDAPKAPMKISPPLAIATPDLGGAEHVPYKLPDVAGNIVIAGGGRFLAIRFRDLQQIGIFDINLAKIVKKIPVADKQIFLAGGLNKLFIVQGDSRLVSRWDLASFEREASAPLAFDGPLLFASTGSSSNGPLVIGSKEGAGPIAHFLDGSSLRRVDMELENGDGAVKIDTYFRSSANGKVFSSWGSAGMQILVRDGTTLRVSRELSTPKLLLPSPDGAVVYSEQDVWSAEAKRLAPADPDRKPRYPAVHGDFFLMDEGGVRRGRTPVSPGQPKPCKLSLYRRGQGEALLAIDGIEPVMKNWRDSLTLPNDQRIFFIPDASLLITVGLTGDVLNLHAIDLDKVKD